MTWEHRDEDSALLMDAMSRARVAADNASFYATSDVPAELFGPTGALERALDATLAARRALVEAEEILRRTLIAPAAPAGLPCTCAELLPVGGPPAPCAVHGMLGEAADREVER